MATRLYGREDPVGRSVVVGGRDGPRLQIVGLAGDVRTRDLTTDLVARDTDPDVYMPWPQFPTGAIIVVARAAGDPAGPEPLVRDVVAEVDRDLAVANPGPLARGVEQAGRGARSSNRWLGSAWMI